MPKVRQPKLDFETSVIIGKGLEAMSQGRERTGTSVTALANWKDYLYGKE